MVRGEEGTGKNWPGCSDRFYPPLLLYVAVLWLRTESPVGPVGSCTSNLHTPKAPRGPLRTPYEGGAHVTVGGGQEGRGGRCCTWARRRRPPTTHPPSKRPGSFFPKSTSLRHPPLQAASWSRLLSSSGQACEVISVAGSFHMLVFMTSALPTFDLIEFFGTCQAAWG